MKNEKELKKEIEKIRGSDNFDEDDMEGSIDEITGYIYLIQLEEKLRTLRERNAEVKQVIEGEEFVEKLIDWDIKNAKVHGKELWIENMSKKEFEGFLNHHGAEMFDKVCYEFLQKLGLEDGK